MSIVLVALLVAACSGETKRSPEIDRLTWLLGTWQGTTNNFPFYESWADDQERGFKGKGFRIVDGDTVFGETLRLESRGKDVYYVADVEHNADEVAFKLVRITDTQVVFENPDHDFPQRFIYTRRDDGTLYIRAESTDPAVDRALEFYLEKVE
jgi:hypothetical protein